jgi:hypothetical protein
VGAAQTGEKRAAGKKGAQGGGPQEDEDKGSFFSRQ